MGNELQLVTSNWIELSDNIGKLPAPFEQEIFLMHCKVAGTTYAGDVAGKTEKMVPGDTLLLRRDVSNKYDSHAIAVLTEGEERIGWVPQRENAVISRLMDSGKMLFGRLESKDPPGKTGWMKIKIAVYMRDV